MRDGLVLAISALTFGLIFGAAARQAGLSLLDVVAMSTLVCAGASQMAAVGMIGQGAGWPAIVAIVAFLNARQLLYSASLARLLAPMSWARRATSAFVVTDEVFALTAAHWRRAGRVDQVGLWLAAACICVPWIAASGLGYVVGTLAADPATLGLDLVFPTAMGGLAVGLVSERREIVAIAAGITIAGVVALVVSSAAGVLAGGIGGPVVALVLPVNPRRDAP